MTASDSDDAKNTLFSESDIERYQDYRRSVLDRVAKGFMHESERGCVIVGAALLSEALERLLRASFRHAESDAEAIDMLFQGYAPLSSLSAKTDISYASGILPRHIRDKVNFVRRLRNDFAHESGPLDFRDSRYVDRIAPFVQEPRVIEILKARGEEGEPRQVFVTSLAYTIAQISVLTELVRKRVKFEEGKELDAPW